MLQGEQGAPLNTRIRRSPPMSAAPLRHQVVGVEAGQSGSAWILSKLPQIPLLPSAKPFSLSRFDGEVRPTYERINEI